MTHKERMLKTARGEWADRLPWAPRIDLWFSANSIRGTLPAKYPKQVTLDEIADDLGGGYHKIAPDFLRIRSPGGNIDRGIGIYHLWGMAYRPELVGVEEK